MRNPASAWTLRVLACVAVLGAALGAQTIGMPFLNDLSVDLGPTGAPLGPPFGVPCPAPPTMIPPLASVALTVGAPAPGLTVMIFIAIPGPIAVTVAGCVYLTTVLVGHIYLADHTDSQWHWV